ncbi:MAG: DoxX family protein [Winogradskyella sp.]|uniref:DoxX family protein n=1 Tax=Winogradskyella sp. TaxID=1883156 RepID=UPI0025FCDE16|nr:hypothetical protein [Winogradskyella sp.]NRB61168.1 DoxX family protein [Winogradskyella sp.]
MEIKVKGLLKISLIVFYAFAGTYHFINPNFYLGLIPDYLPCPLMINYIAGVVEVVLAIGIVFKTTGRLAAFGLIAMLVAFIPSHVYFIQIGSCVPDALCVYPIIAWIRLLVIHPILIWWVWKVKG